VSDPARADPLLGDLDPSQRAAVTHEAPTLAILAPAGSGKTRVLTRRVAWLVEQRRVSAENVLAVTFTRKAAGELANRLGRLGVRHVTAGTFHSLALAQLRRHMREHGREAPAVLGAKGRIIGPLVGGRGPAARVAVLEIAGEIEWAKARLVGPGDYAAAALRAGRVTPRPPTEIAAVYERYEQEKRRRHLFDFDDLLRWCAQMIERDETFAAAQRFRFRSLFVDEFQDASAAQVRLVRAWLGDRPDLCVVGDDDQAIYSFAGADPGPLRDFAAHFPGGIHVRLGANYRSTTPIVAAASAVLDRARTPPQAPRGDGPAPEVLPFDDENGEAAGVARLLSQAHARGVSWSDMAVLYRTNAQSVPFETALPTAGVPVRVPGSGGFVNRPEVRVVLDELVATERAARGRSFSDQLADLAAGEPVGGEERREHLDAVLRLGKEYLAADGGGGSAGGFVAWLETSMRGDDGLAVGERSDAVQLVSFHRAKGLEWELVCVTGVERGLVPISYATEPEPLAEERRLLHVALSRAGQFLSVTWARQRTVGGRPARRSRSPWLDAIEAANRGGAAPPDPKVRLTAMRADLRARRPLDVPAPDSALFHALKDWRRDLARARGVPAYVVFRDATLVELATVRPTSLPGLLDVTGIGPTKAELYGDDVLELVARHVASRPG
jgi:DNA helicase-2/ATP-dependent DNA helicase PcrA